MLTDDPNRYLDPEKKIFVLKFNNAYMCVCSTLEIAGNTAKKRLAEFPWLLDQFIDIYETIIDAPISTGIVRVWSDGHTSVVEPPKPRKSIEEAWAEHKQQMRRKRNG